MSDIEIAQAAKMRPIIGLCGEKFAIDPMDLEPYGHYKAKLSLSKVRAAHPRHAALSYAVGAQVSALQADAAKPNGKLILVTAMSPTPAGEVSPHCQGRATRYWSAARPR